MALVRAVTPAAPSAAVTHAASNPAASESVYPYESTTRIGPWGFTNRHAADYIAWRFFERDVTPFGGSPMAGPNGTVARFGDPATWATHAGGLGFTVDTVPRAGAIAQWNAGE